MMTPTQLRDDLLRLLGMEVPSSAPTFMIQVVADCLNGAAQELYDATGAFFRQEEQLAAGTTGGVADFNLQLCQSILAVQDCDTGRALRKLKQKDYVAAYAGIYGGSSIAQAYFADRYTDSTGAQNCELTIAPVGAPDLQLNVTVTAACPAMSAADLGLSGNTVTDAIATLPYQIPEQWVELHFLLIARKWSMGSHYWLMKENTQFYQAEYQAAITRLKAMNPRPDIRDPLADVRSEGRSTT